MSVEVLLEDVVGAVKWLVCLYSVAAPGRQPAVRHQSQSIDQTISCPRHRHTPAASPVTTAVKCCKPGLSPGTGHHLCLAYSISLSDNMLQVASQPLLQAAVLGHAAAWTPHCPGCSGRIEYLLQDIYDEHCTANETDRALDKSIRAPRLH